MAITPKQYKIYFTPRTGINTYGDEIEVSAKIVQSGASNMKKSIDAADYDIGVFYYGDLTIRAINKNGTLSEPKDFRSIFRYSRDLTKVRVEYLDKDGGVDVFNGLINEEATREDFETNKISFKVLSLDSVIRTTRIPNGSIINGVTFKSALQTILNKPDITTILTYNASKINPNLNLTIDDGSKFDSISTRDGLSKLLIASNSVFIINSSNEMIIQSRSENSGGYTELYGPFSQKERANILKVSKYNNGKQRLFTVVKVGTQTKVQSNYLTDDGYRQKSIKLDFITNTDTQLSIAQNISNEFKFPKIELEVTVETSLAKNLDLLDKILIDYPLRLKPETKFFPIVGDAKIDDVATKLPYEYGSSFITNNIPFKIIEIKQNVKEFTTILKLRQLGVDTGDGFINTNPASSLVGFAVIDISKVA
jgi:hypothetical protein